MTSTLPINTYPQPDYENAHRNTFSSAGQKPITSVLPPGVRKEDFTRAIAEFASVVGESSVFVGDGLRDYHDPYDIWEDDEKKRKVPSAAVCPASVDEIRGVLAVANRHKIPLWTFSRGKNLGYGGPAPRVNGSVALDLHRMNKIIEVNDDHAYAVVEPGVSFIELYNYCVEHKKKVWPSTPSLGWGSVTGNTLERGCGFGSNFNHHGAMSGLEVLLADGDLVRTGQFGISNSPSAFLSKFSYGPSVEGLFLQSNLGIVTKLSIWLTPQPSSFMACTFQMPEFKDLEVMVDTFGEMKRSGMLQSAIWMTSAIETLCIRGKRRDFWQGEGPIPDWRVEELMRENKTGYWLARWGLYGPKRIVQAQFDEIKETFGQRAPTGEITGAFYAGKDGGPLDAASIPQEHGNMMVGIPSLWSLPLVEWALPSGKGKPAHGDYAPIIPSSGKALVDWMRVSKPAYEEAGLELMSDFFMHERHVVVMNMFTYDQQDLESRKRVHKLYYDLHQLAKERGYGMYRAHVNHMDLIAGLNDFNDHAYNRFVERLKDAVDPNGILAPGKQGIWPNRFRHLRETQERDD